MDERQKYVLKKQQLNNIQQEHLQQICRQREQNQQQKYQAMNQFRKRLILQK